jgi:hypothetical protein
VLKYKNKFGSLRVKVVPSVYAKEASRWTFVVKCGRPTRHFSEIWGRISSYVSVGLQYRALHKKTQYVPACLSDQNGGEFLNTHFIPVFEIIKQELNDVAGLRRVFIS